MLPVGAVIKMKNGKAVIKRKIGDGGQGAVYVVEYKGREKALKMYHKDYLYKLLNIEKFYRNLENNIKMGPPGDAFLWPEDITPYSCDEMGYIMELIPDGYKNLGQFNLLNARFETLEARVNAAIHIVENFWKLHSKGYSYQDINNGNFFIHPKTGHVLICDNDNVCATGYHSGIVGKTTYMAPKVVLGKKLPDKHTDRFSMAVVLFMCFFVSHPLEGKNVTQYGLMTPAREAICYGKNPIFIFDETDDSNRPVVGRHNNAIRLWPFYPRYIQELFLKSFDKAVMQEYKPNVLEKEWFRELIRLRAEIVRCSHCGEAFFASADTCLHCSASNAGRWLYFRLEGLDVPVTIGGKFYDCYIADIGEARDVNAQSVIGEIIPSKNNPNIPGLKNNSPIVWQADFGKGFIEYGPQKAVPLVAGVKIKIANAIVDVICK